MIVVQGQVERGRACESAAVPTADLIEKYSRPGPRYTSYPPVPYWPQGYGPERYQEALAQLGQRVRTDPGRAVSVYVHIPFCERRCTFCACNVVISRAHERGSAYVVTVLKEMDLAAAAMGGNRPRIKQLHWGGGTPTWLSAGELAELYRGIEARFEMDPQREQSIEVDPRVTTPEQLGTLRSLGLNRLSMGVQDIDPTVQDAINRHQSVDQTAAIINQARALGISGITVDLVYGLPYQTPESFRRTVRTAIDLGVDRAAVYNFAYLPDRVRHQRAIRAETLPGARTRMELFRIAAAEFASAGYDMIGMDHFAKATDELSLARRDGSMQRNFMGYTTRAGCDLLAFGVSAISRVGRDFAQNAKTTEEYAAAVERGELPICHGMRLSDEDVVRESVIQQIMCYGRVDLDVAGSGLDLLASDRAAAVLRELIGDGLVTLRGRVLDVTPLGRYFVRNIAMVFDGYLGRPPAAAGEGRPVQVRFSKTV